MDDLTNNHGYSILWQVEDSKIPKEVLISLKDLEDDNFHQVKLESRKPRSKNVWYFRIFKKYRAFAKNKEMY